MAQAAAMMRPTLLLAAMAFPAIGVAAAAAPAPTPVEIVAATPAGEWVRIDPADLLVMDLAPDARGRARRVVIQLQPRPFSQGWVDNVRRLAAAHWWDGLSVNRVQDNYVAQWGDADGEDAARARPLPPGLATVPQSAYAHPPARPADFPEPGDAAWRQAGGRVPPSPADSTPITFRGVSPGFSDIYWRGFPFTANATAGGDEIAPIHCYGSVGVGRNMPPDTGSGAELYAVIGQAPRQLDRNIAVVGRVIAGIEHLSSLPRGTGPLGFYETAAERVPILSVRTGDGVPGLPAYEYLATSSAGFRRYADARANRRDPFYLTPAGGADICNVPVPVRRVPSR